MNIAVYLKSESCDSYLYLYSVEQAKEVINNLIKDNYDFELKCICDYEVKSNIKKVNAEVKRLISDYLDSEEEI